MITNYEVPMGRYATCFGYKYLCLRALASIILAEHNYTFVRAGAAVVTAMAQ